jgi:uncharacterized radical SAM superfamily protein
MEKIRNPEGLVAYCNELEKREGKGILVSGGCDKNGRLLHLHKVIGALKKIKKHSRLFIAIHPGYVDADLADNLADACDIAFVEIIGCEDTAQDIMGLKKMMGIDTLENLMHAGVPITPHLTIGLHYGTIAGEYDALETLNDFPFKKIVLNIICQTKGTAFEKTKIPPLVQIRDVMEKAMKGREVALGCMRPRNWSIEEMAIKIGVTHIAVPSKKTLRYAIENGYSIHELPICCGVPEEDVRSYYGQKA